MKKSKVSRSRLCRCLSPRKLRVEESKARVQSHTLQIMSYLSQITTIKASCLTSPRRLVSRKSLVVLLFIIIHSAILLTRICVFIKRIVNQSSSLCYANSFLLNSMYDFFCSIIVCHLNFKSGVLRIDSDNDRNSTIIEIKRDGEQGWTACLEYPKPIDFSVHTYISSGGMHNNRRSVTIN